jgi:hypothetical protein
MFCPLTIIAKSTRRKVKKLLLFYKIVNKEAPDYLYELVPPLVAPTVNYNNLHPFVTCI